MSEGSPLRSIAADLRSVLRKGLPVVPSTPSLVLRELDSVVVRAIDPTNELSRTAALSKHLESLARRFEQASTRDALRTLLGDHPNARGRTLTERRKLAAARLGYEYNHFRLRLEPRLLERFALQIHEDNLRFVRQPGRSGPPNHPVVRDLLRCQDQAEEAAARIWSTVFALRAALLCRDRTQRRPDVGHEHARAQGDALWHLATLLRASSDYRERFGAELNLGGGQSVSVDDLALLAGWQGEVTGALARQLGRTLDRVGPNDRDSFVAALRATEATS